MSVSFLERTGKPTLAYQSRQGATQRSPQLLFLGGFASDMEGTKAAHLDLFCANRGYGYVRFDYAGHGRSAGDFAKGTIGGWFDDALDVIDGLTQGPVLLIGSSMGGWIGLLTCLARSSRVLGYVGLAAAPDFTRDVQKAMNQEQRAQMAREGFFPLPHYGGDHPPVITRALLEEGERHCLLDKPIPISCPVRLIQGVQDSEVPWQKAETLMKALQAPDKKLFLQERGDHRLSTPEDLKLLEDVVSGLISDVCI